MILPLTCSMRHVLLDCRQFKYNEKFFSPVVELSSKLISDQLYANLDSLQLFSICQDDSYIDDLDLFLYSVGINFSRGR